MERIIPDVMKPEPQTSAPEKIQASENDNPMFEQEESSPYGYCPQCGARGKSTERRPDGDTICEAGHKHARSKFLATKPQQTAAPYGYCPECAAPGKMRSKTIGETHDVCANNHSYPSSSAVMSQTAAPQKQTARFENTHEGQCPSCGNQMRLSVANGIPVHVCMEHSVVMPIRDAEPLHVQ